MAQRKWLGVLAFVAAAGVVASGASLAQPAVKVPKEKDKDKEKEKAPPRRGGGPVLGDTAPLWAAKDPDGKEHKLTDYKGKVVVMDFWATWCGPCKRAMPGLQKLHEEFKDQGVVVVGMNFGEKPGADPAAYMKSQNLDYLLLLNTEQVARDYGVQGIPAFYVIDQEGKVILREVGFSPASERKLHDTVSRALAGQKPRGKNPDRKKPDGREGDKKPEKPDSTSPGSSPRSPGRN